MVAGTEAEIDDIGFFTPQQMPAQDARRGRGRLPHHRHQGRHEAARRRHADHEGQGRATEPLPGYREVKPMVFCGLFPIDSDAYPELRDALEKLDAQRRRAAVGAGDLRCARLRLPLRLPRPAAHGHRARAARARVRPRADGDDAVRRVRGDADRRRDRARPQPDRHARPGAHRRDPRALHQGLDPRRRRSSSARSWSSARSAAASTPACTTSRPSACSCSYDLPLVRDRARLLRPAEVAHPRLRVARLRAARAAPVGPGQARRAARRRPGRRALDGRAPRQGLRVRQDADREAAQEDPAPAVRRRRSRPRSGRRSSPARPSRPSART